MAELKLGYNTNSIGFDPHLEVTVDEVCGLIFYSRAMEECIICDLFLFPGWRTCTTCRVNAEVLVTISEMLANWRDHVDT